MTVNVNRAETPVDRLIAAFGVKRVAAIGDVTSDAVRKWKRRRSTGGGGGLVPATLQQRYLDVARSEGLTLTEADLIGEPVQ